MATTAQRQNVRYPTQQQGGATTNGASRTSSQRRASQSPARYEPEYAQEEFLPPAPEVPRGPPVSYRQPVQTQSPLASTGTKSFSERARASPRQNLTDQEQWAPHDEVTSGRAGESNRRAQRRERQVDADEYSPVSPKHAEEPMRKGSTRQAMAEADDSQPRAQPRDLPHINTRSSARHTDQRRSSAQVTSSVSRSTSVREPANTMDRNESEWAAGSPLQKLELTLNDISKAEKRARVKEAEMLLRETLAAQASRRGSRDARAEGSSAPRRGQSQRAANVPSRAIEESLPKRSLTTSQRPTSDQRVEPEARRSSGRRPSAQEPGQRYNVEEEEEPVEDEVKRQTDQFGDSKVPAQRHPAHDPKAVANTSTATARGSPPLVYDAPPAGMRRNGSSRQTRVEQLEQSIPSNITRAVSSQKGKPPTVFRDDSEAPKTGPVREVNTSHKGALMEGASAGAVAAAAAAATNGVGRSNSRKLQKEPPRRTRAQEGYDTPQQQPETEPRSDQMEDQTAQFYGRGASKQIDIQRSSSKRGAAPVGLGLDHAAMEERKNSSTRDPTLSDPKIRRQSVSFKQPFDRARPVDEWKEAGVARLQLSDFDLTEVDKDKAWWEGGSSHRRRSRRSSGIAANFDGGTYDPRKVVFDPPLHLKCGPLLRYTGLKRDKLEDSRGRPIERETWRGSIMIVTQDAHSSYEYGPTLRLFSQPMDLLPPPPAHVGDDNDELPQEYVDPLAGMGTIARDGRFRYVRPIDHIEPERDLSRLEDDEGLFERSPSAIVLDDGKTIESPNKRYKGTDGERVGKYKEVQGHRIYADLLRGVTFWRFYLEIELGDKEAHIAYRINKGAPVGFWVPARGHAMNMMFHSCNGFSLSVKPDVFSGPDPMWRDVLNTHQTRPFHVMIGGGDQIYNDRVMIETTHFAQWLRMKNPHDKHHAELTPEMEEELETFYLDRYAMWFSQGLFGMANSQIPMVNIWDDHDIIDGFGSYPDHFMRTPVFSGLGNIAFKYYMLFQHQSVPEETEKDEPSWLLGPDPGPYIAQRSRSLFMLLGKGVAFLGLDCRTERKRDVIMSNDTIDTVLERCRREIVEGDTKHLIVLLGVPIAYPRLVWLENVLTSRVMDPIKALGRAGLLKGGFLNKFDGGVEILDDLDDHWTASGHKAERQDLINDLQDLAAEKSVRITILGGDVHLAAVGQFYTNPKYKIPKDRDHRYMTNVISSAICNTPPGEMLADVLNKRNKIHHFDEFTDENMIPMFTHDVDGKKRNNKALLPRRNWCSIREYFPGTTPPPTPSPPATPTESERSFSQSPPRMSFSFSRSDMKPGGILRRLSLRGRAPPSSYRDDMNYSNPENRRPTSANSAPMRRSSLQHDYRSPPSQSQDATPNMSRQSIEQQLRKGPVIQRPGNFQRRPTNLSEKAGKKGGGIAEDGEGGYNDHINLEGGLDIILNLEVSQKDPAGITVPYRLLVPALFYDGTSDSMHHEAVEGGVKRSGSLLKRFGLGRRQKNSIASHQGQGQWGHDSEPEDEDEADAENALESDQEYTQHHPRAQGGGDSFQDTGEQSSQSQRNGVYSQGGGFNDPGRGGYDQGSAGYSQGGAGYGRGSAGYDQGSAGYGQRGAGQGGAGQGRGGYNGVEAYREKSRWKWF